MFRSQMAAALYNKLTGSQDAFSVGTYTGAPEEPEGLVLGDLPKRNLLSEHFFKVMEDNGMYIREHRTTKLLPEMLDQYDVVVNMAQEGYIPDFLKKCSKVVWWTVADTKYITEDVAKETFEQVNKLVRELIASLDISLS